MEEANPIAARSVSGKLVGVQAARGVAAILVVAYHTTRSISLPQYLGYIPFGNALGFGHAGVDFFFVLSGFIIAHAHAADIGRPERVWRYLWRRITRIYPIYWFVTGLELIRGIFAPDAAVRTAMPHVIRSMLLLPDDLGPLVSVAWTLQSEMLFYLIFALPIIRRQTSIPLVTCSLLLVVLGMTAEPTGPWLGLLGSPFNIEFLMGIGVARFLAHHRPSRPAAMIAIGVTLFLTVGAMELAEVIPLLGLTGRLLYGSASVVILLGLVEIERSGTIRLGLGSILLGDASYCLYLTHLTLIPLAVRGFMICGLLALVPALPLFLILVAASLGVGIAIHLRVELLMMRFLRSHTPRLCR